MAFIQHTRASNVSNSGFAVVNNAFAALAAWNDKRQTRKALNALSSRELEDIGLCRGDIEDVTQRMVRR